MTHSDLNPRTVQALLDLNPAPASTLTAGERRRAAATLEHILTGPDHTGTLGRGTAGRPPRARAPRTRRLALLGAATLVVTTAAVGAQVLGGGNTAYATWTATPDRPASSQEARAATACRDSLTGSLNVTPQSDPDALLRRSLPNAAPLVAEQRGHWTLVVLGDGRGLDAACLTETRTDGPSHSSFSAVAYRAGVALAPRDVLVTNGGTGGSADHLISLLIGYVGKDITALTVHTAEHGPVTATVDNGRVAAWWPGPEGIDVTDPRLTTTAEVTITYTDDTTQDRQLNVGQTSRQ